MAADDAENGERATLALVSAKIDGLRELTRAEFINLQRQMDSVAELPTEVAKLTERQEGIEHRLTVVERDAQGNRDWRRNTLLIVAATIAAAFINVALFVVH